MKISVTAEDIVKGLPDDPCSCPVALAVRRAVEPGEAEIVFTQEYGIELWEHGTVDTGTIWRVPSPPEVRSFIGAFDRGMPVQPFDFDLEIPA